MTKPNAKRPTRGKQARRLPETGKVAAQLRGEAKQRGATGIRVTYAQRSLRDSAIIAGLQAGRDEAELAKDFELSRRQIKRIRDAENHRPSVLDDDPRQLVQELLRSCRGLVADFEAMADHYRETHPNVALGAKRSAAEQRGVLADLLMAFGMLPRDFRIFRYEADIARLGHAVIDALARFEAGDLERDELLETVREAIRPSLPTVEGTEAG